MVRGRGGADLGGGARAGPEGTLHAGRPTSNEGGVSRSLPQGPLLDSCATGSAALVPRLSFRVGSQALCRLCPTPCAALTAQPQAQGR